jgi:hypothetical protein
MDWQYRFADDAQKLEVILYHDRMAKRDTDKAAIHQSFERSRGHIRHLYAHSWPRT